LLLDFWNLYGDTFEIVVNGKRVVCIADGKEGRKILREGDVFHRSTRFAQASQGILEGALFTIPTGPTWYRHRKLLQPAFGPMHLEDVANVTDERVRVAIKLWSDTIAKQGPIEVDMYSNVTSLTVDVMYVALI
jgi:cytochrome P450